MGETASFYDVHKALSIAKNVIGVDVVMSSIKNTLIQNAFDISSENMTSLVVSNSIPDINCSIYDVVNSEINILILNNADEINRVLMNAGFPDGYVATNLISNLEHMYFIIPLHPAGTYEIKI